MKPANTMSHIDTISASRSLHGSMMDREDHSLSLSEVNHFSTRLHARSLLCQHELASGKIAAWLREKKCDLQGKYVLTVEILMKAIEVARYVL